MSAAAEIARALGGRRHETGYLCRCPVATHGAGRGDRNPSLSVRDGEEGKILVNCFAGCDGRDILDALRRRGLLDDRPPVRDPGPAPRCEAIERIEPDERALALWRRAQPINGTLAHRYLRARGLTIEPPPSLRFFPALEYLGERIAVPAMVAAVQAPDRRAVALQITYLDPRGDRKAQVATPRRTIGKLYDGAVRLGPAGDELGIAEGVETALAAMQLTGVPCWACLGAKRMPSVAIPDTVQRLHIFADNDQTGQDAADATAQERPSQGVLIHTPRSPFKDFADVAADLLKAGAAA